MWPELLRPRFPLEEQLRRSERIAHLSEPLAQVRGETLLGESGSEDPAECPHHEYMEEGDPRSLDGVIGPRCHVGEKLAPALVPPDRKLPLVQRGRVVSVRLHGS